ncbi:hypothetical protein DL766_009382 [Monosporascus sp. MC13-8B]|uniref:Uncharacterized protein n=1 Tax=Monosporascus cannonballus TaxID=155416 RepID=A0ABY0HES8_9PEZI|nr:hypothetical protein DL762_003549 [Monosporascus cannonballus]RYO96537.1 hypothetical protein DL763_003156 [Monosporascus cannonballus]RYP15558.1 hypothetical protein DL766_009382 [Monosporascus sp. MC13-8B]
MRNNKNSTLPGDLLHLEEAESIYLNGVIDTTASSNIFPSLKRSGIINDLRCNGTDNGTLAATETTDEMAGHAAISQGARAGIGVGGGLLFLGVLAAVNLQPSYSTHGHASGGLYETEGKPCGSGRAQLEGAEIQEMGGEQVLREKTDDSMAKEPRFETARTGHDGPPVELESCAC